MTQEDRQMLAILVLLVVALLFFASYLLALAVRYRRVAHRDAIRFRLFAARDRLYLAAADGLVPVEGELFQQLRFVINFVIRESDGAGFNEFFPLFGAPNEDSKASTTLEARIAQLPAPARAVYIDILKDALFATHDLFMLNSRLARLFRFLKRMATKMDQAADEHPVTTARQLEHSMQEVQQLSVTFRSAWPA
jgi:hypothetical protein